MRSCGATQCVCPLWRGVVAVLLSITGLGAEILPADQPDPQIYHRQIHEGEYHVLADNPLSVGVYFYVTDPAFRNIRADVDFPYIAVVESGTKEQLLFTLRTIDPAQGNRLSYSYTFGYGNPYHASHQSEHHYLFPYRHGTKHVVGQGYNGRFSHSRPGENHSLDFNMEPNTPIHAARAGVVARVKESSNRGGPSQRYSNSGNYIIIMHNDGSFGHYVHLIQNGALVRVGQYVAAGAHIGYSGNTGFSSGPHLHFDVRVPQLNGGMQTVPTKFVHYNNQIVEPQEGQFYYAVHPNGEPFEAIIGSDLRVADYAGYLRSVPRNERIDFRTERIDNSFVAFVSNGYPRARTLEIQFANQGVTAERKGPLTLTVPAQAEIVCNIFHATGRGRIRIAPTIKPVE